MNFKSIALVMGLFVTLQACSIFLPRIPYQMGMTESKFLRQNRGAVISQLDTNRKVYRLNTDERFYLLATFEDGILTNLEERELTPMWQQQRMMDSNNPNIPNNQ